MACFLVCATEATIATIATKIVKKNESAPKTLEVKLDGEHIEQAEKISFSKKLGWLNRLLWGGTALLAFEHIWHGEVVPFFPYLTAASNLEDTAEMLHEMATTGVSMALLVTVIWLGMLAVSSIIEKRALKQAAETASVNR